MESSEELCILQERGLRSWIEGDIEFHRLLNCVFFPGVFS